MPLRTAQASHDVTPPPADEQWHPIAKMVYEAHLKSGQNYYFEHSDVAGLYLGCDNLSRDLKPKFLGVNDVTGEEIVRTVPISGANLSAYLKLFSGLGMTEGDRRRMGIELQRATTIDEDEAAADAAVIEASSRFAG